MWHVGPEEEYFSLGFRGFLSAIQPDGRMPSAHFPQNYSETRFAHSDNLKSWLCRIIDSLLDGSVNSCQVEENMAVFASIRYQDTMITYARIHCLIADTDLTSFRVKENAQCWYFRLEYDPNRLGSMFAEPLPHVHTVPDGAPRFGQHHVDGNIVLDFFDFIYRNFHYDKWRAWAHHACQRSPHRATVSDDQFQAMEEAFKAGKYRELIDVYGTPLDELKRACRKMKDHVFSARIDHQIAVTLSY